MAISLLSACDNKKEKVREKSSTTKDDYRSDESTRDKTEDKTSDDRTESNANDNTGNWSRSDENRFMDDCVMEAEKNAGAARANEYCDCMLQKIKKMYSNYAEADRKLAGISKTELDELAASCNQ